MAVASESIQSTYNRHTCLNIMASLLSCVFLSVAGLPASAAANDSALPDVFSPENLLWEIRLGTHQYTTPRIDRDRIFIGINDMALDHPAAKRTGGGVLMCLDRSTGEMIWQLPIPRYMEGVKPPYHFNQWKCGVCSSPAVEGDRLYIVGPRGDVLCLDRNGQAEGNQGPFLDETEYMAIPQDSGYKLTRADGDIIWRFDMITEVGAVPHDVCGSSSALHGQYLYACTSNGQDDRHKLVANPLAPSLIVLDKHTGRLAATDGELIGKRMFHGHWSSPVAVETGGRTMILFGGGDGILYAFKPFDPKEAGKDNPTLEKIWQCDCNPGDYRRRDGREIPYATHTNKSPDGPAEIIATPVVADGRIYVAIGESPIHGPGKGMLSCIDAAAGKIIWTSRLVERSISNVALHDGLVYAADYSGRLHCLDADTGQQYWQHELEAGVWTASPIVIDGKVYIGAESGLLWIFEASKQKTLIARSRLKSAAITPVIHEGVLYLPTQKRLFALKIR
ncbi:MAG: PQQ-binding-like beta-propeller repeat protein [Sedimentisphaerales bacterium]|nr:PQQ-binding-like beta-propeller repeat protein [Sedimentisphaerales bacterium]